MVPNILTTTEQYFLLKYVDSIFVEEIESEKIKLAEISTAFLFSFIRALTPVLWTPLCSAELSMTFAIRINIGEKRNSICKFFQFSLAEHEIYTANKQDKTPDDLSWAWKKVFLTSGYEI